MARKQPTEIQVDTFPDHQVITQPNPLRKLVRPADEEHVEAAVARAEQALDGISGEFAEWMKVE